MGVAGLFLLFLAQAPESPAIISCDDLDRLRRPVTEIDIAVSNLNVANDSRDGGSSLSRVVYAGNGRTVTVTTTVPSDPNWREITECRYDKKQRLVKETTTSYEKRKVEERATLSYQHKDSVTIATTNGKKTYFYRNSNGQVVSGKSRGPGRYYGEDIEYQYLDDRVEVRWSWSDFDVSGWETYIYDKHGNLTRSEANGGSLVQTWVYEFDDLGNWIRRVGTLSGNGAGGDWRMIETRRIQYR